MRKKKSLTLLLLVVLVMNQLFTGTIFASGIDEGISEEVINELVEEAQNEITIDDENDVTEASQSEELSEMSEDETDACETEQTEVLWTENNFIKSTEGYYIINGANMVWVDDTLYYSNETGIHMSNNGNDVLINTDNARNLNYYEGLLYYTIGEDDSTYIKIIDVLTRDEINKIYLPGYKVKHMYLVCDNTILVSADGKVYSLDLQSEEVKQYSELENIFSFIPTKYGVIYATGTLFDYCLYADGDKIGEGISDYFVQGNFIICRDQENKEVNLSLDVIYGMADEESLSDADTADIQGETISLNQFLDEISSVSVAEEEIIFPESKTMNDMKYAEDYENPHDRTKDDKPDGLTRAKSIAVQDEIVKKAEDIYNDVWVRKGDIKEFSPNVNYMEDEIIHGVPYAQPVKNGKYVFFGMTYEEFVEERNNEDSLLYSKNKSDWSYYTNIKGITNYGPKYGLDCSGFVSYCWGLPTKKSTSTIPLCATKIGPEDKEFRNIQIGDVINSVPNKEGHVILITDVEYDSMGSIRWIETIEQTVPYTKWAVYYELSELESSHGRYTLYRKSGITGTSWLNISEKSMQLYVGEGKKLSAEWAPGGKLSWSSSDSSIATVDNDGNIRAVAAGIAYITATVTSDGADDMVATCAVVVKEKSLSIPSKLTAYVGYRTAIDAVADPIDTITWKSADKEIATVSSDGIVTGKATGTVKITAKANGITKTCSVTVKEPSLSISKSSVTLYLLDGYDTKQLSATPKPSTTVQWTSSDSSIVTVDNTGNIKALKKGTVTIKAKANGITKKCTVTVKNPSLALSKSTLNIYPATTGTIIATASPNTSVKWSSSNTSVATVSGGKVTGVGVGTATITVKANGLTKKCTVNVLKPSFTIDKSSMSIYVGGSGTIGATAKPSTSIKWTSSNTSVAQVNSSGVVTGVGTGTATISATAHGVTRTCMVTVYRPTFTINQTGISMVVGTTATITASANPATTITWSTSNSSIAQVSGGVVRGVGVGNAVITARAHGISRTCKVTVYRPTN